MPDTPHPTIRYANRLDRIIDEIARQDDGDGHPCVLASEDWWALICVVTAAIWVERERFPYAPGHVGVREDALDRLRAALAPFREPTP